MGFNIDNKKYRKLSLKKDKITLKYINYKKTSIVSKQF